MIRKLSVACVLALAAVSLGFQSSDLPAVLQKALKEYKDLKYTGTRVVEFKRGPDRRTHTEHVIRLGKSSRVEFPSTSPFAGQIIIEHKGRRLHYFPDKKEVHVMPARRDEAYQRLFGIFHDRDSKIEVKVLAGETVAGVRTQQVAVSDKKGGNVVQRLYIDPESGMILKREIFDPVGTLVGSFEFSSVKIDAPIRSKDFAIRAPGAKWLDSEDLAVREAKNGGFLPMVLSRNSGYELEHTRTFSIGGVPVLAQMYIGPKKRISLFQLKQDVEESRLQRLGRGSSVRVYSWKHNGRTFALVGELKAEELQDLSKRLAER